MILRSNQVSSMLSTMQELHEGSVQMETSRTGQIDQFIRSLESMRLQNGSSITERKVAQLHQQVSTYNAAASGMSKEQSIFRSLCFQSMTVRHSSIAEAYSRTYSWIFNSSFLGPSDRRSRIKFTEWLQSPERIYWVSGKAGSGKSTLMKYVQGNWKTKHALRIWAGNSSLITASFYFWNAGTTMQKSQQGLLQSLLFKILSQCPNLVPFICPNRFNSSGPYSDSAAPWSLSELSAAFRLLKEQGPTDTKFCFFIDGLDEYEGDYFDLINTLKDMANSPNIKLCVSSRPWPCFEDAFGSDQHLKLYLQDLTRDDIALFARGKLEDHFAAAALKRDVPAYEDLIKQIVERAQGVFLWVYLVVRSLREGLSNGDGILLLQARLRSLPSDLEALFERMLDSVDKVYKAQMAVTFKVALASDGPLLMMTCSFLEEEDPDFAIKLHVGPSDMAEIESRKETLHRRLSGSYKGLLEIQADHLFKGHLYFKYSIGFLHRTLRDFLILKEIQQLLNSFLGGSRRPPALLCRALLAQLKTMPTPIDRDFALDLLEQSLRAAGQEELEGREADVVVGDELARVLEERLYVDEKTEASLLERAIGRGLILYTTQGLNRVPSIIRRDPALIMHALTPRKDFTHMVRLLLRRGASPNQKHMDSSVWESFFDSYPYYGDEQEHENWRRYLRMLLRYGVDINSSSAWWLFLLEGYNGKSNAALTDMIKVAEIFFANGADPNQNPYSIEVPTPWETYLLTALQLVLNLGPQCPGSVPGFPLEPKSVVDSKVPCDVMRYTASVITLFLRYGANTRLLLRSGDSVPSIVQLILEGSRYLTDLLEIIRSETAHAEAHDRYIETLSGPYDTTYHRWSPLPKLCYLDSAYKTERAERAHSPNQYCQQLEDSDGDSGTSQGTGARRTKQLGGLDRHRNVEGPTSSILGHWKVTKASRYGTYTGRRVSTRALGTLAEDPVNMLSDLEDEVLISFRAI
jgi:hypothetical protein